MPRSLLLLACACVFLAYGVVSGQENLPRDTTSPAAPTITAAATGERVRFVAPSNVVRLQVQLFSEFGSSLLDVSSKGNVFDWTLQDGNGQLLGDGTYLCVVTVKSLSGRISQRVGTVVVLGGVVMLQAQAPRLTTAQQHAVGPVEENAGLTVLQEKGAPAATVVAHDGRDGQLTSTAGALTFRTGNVFAGQEKEQMRITEDGKVGIGTAEPEAKLDVAGDIRTSGRIKATGVEFPDGTVQVSATSGQLNKDGEVSINTASTGTQNQVAKWLDNAGTLGDSVITESAGNIGIGTTTPTQALEVANGRILASGSQTLTAAEGVLEIGTTVTNNNNGASGLRMRNIFNGNATFQQGLDVAPTFAPSASISLARGFISTAFFAPPAGVTITDGFGGNANTVYNNTSGAVTNGAGFAIRTPIVFGALKPTFQYGLRINNQGIVGTNTSYGLFVDAQSGSTNNFSAVFAGGNVGIGTTAPAARLHVAGRSVVTGSATADTPGAARSDVFNTTASVVYSQFVNDLGRWLFFNNPGLGGTGSVLMSMEQNGNLRVNNRLAVGFGGSSDFAHLITVGSVTPKQPLVTGAQVGVYNLGPSFVITRNEELNVEGIFGSDTSANIFGSVSNHPVLFRTNNLDRMAINTAGNVGIGTTSPTSKLHVAGAVNFTGLRTQAEAQSPNVIGGFGANTVAAGVHGATIGGGGFAGFVNQVLGEFGTVGGGSSNTATSFGTVGGGRDNFAGGVDSVVPGGRVNAATGVSSFAAGFRAKANHDGAFVWGDSTAADFASTAPKQFLIRAGGGVGINTNAPATPLHVEGGHIYLGTPGAGIILKSPNGAVCRRLWIDDTGVVQVTGGFACP